MIEKLREFLFKIFRKETFPGRLVDKLVTREIITYLIFGVLTTAVNWVVYTALVKFAGIGITISNAVAWISAVVFAYITNKIFVFESKSAKPAVILREFISFVASRALTGVLEIFGVPALVKLGLDRTIAGVDGAVSKVIVSVAVIIMNYVFSKLIVFRRNKGQ